MNNTLLLIGNRGNKNMGDELILVGILKYFLDRHPNRQSVQVSKGGYREIGPEKYFVWQKPFRQFDKVIIPTSDKKFVLNFLKQFFDEDFIREKVVLVWELPHGIRSFLKWIFQGKFVDIGYYFKADVVSIGGGEIFTEECWSGPLFFTITALPFLIKYFLYKIFGKKLAVYLFGGIQLPYRWFNKMLVKFWINLADGIFLRDFESIEVVAKILYASIKYQKFDKYFLKIKRIYFMFDHSYLLFCDSQTGEVKKFPKNLLNGLAVNINPIGYKKFGEEFFKEFEEKKSKYKPIFYISVNLLEDDKFYFLLKEKYKNNKILKIDYWDTNFKKFVKDIVENVDYAIGMRLHFFLLMCYLGKKITIFTYQYKIKKIFYVIKILKNLTKINSIIILK